MRGSELQRIAPLSEKLMEQIRTIPGAADIDTSEERRRPRCASRQPQYGG
jgi:hypothetical protein